MFFHENFPSPDFLVVTSHKSIELFTGKNLFKKTWRLPILLLI